jgi:hypothetical protein
LFEATANDALEDFIGSLRPPVRKKFVAKLSPTACNGQSTVFACLDGDYLRVIDEMHLYPALVAFTCKHYKCEDIAMCGRFGVRGR